MEDLDEREDVVVCAAGAAVEDYEGARSGGRGGGEGAVDFVEGLVGWGAGGVLEGEGGVACGCRLGNGGHLV